MATKIIRKKTTKKASSPAPVKTVSVSRPIPKPPVTVFGIDFEQGDNITFGKCRRKNAYPDSKIFHFMAVSSGWYLLWNFTPDGYLDYYSAQDPGFTAGYDILDFDTEAPELIPADTNNMVRGAGAIAYNDADF